MARASLRALVARSLRSCPRPQRFGCPLRIIADASPIDHRRLTARDHLVAIDEHVLDIATARVVHQSAERIEQRSQMRSSTSATAG